MPSIKDANITPGTGEISYETLITAENHNTLTTTTVEETVQTTYVVPGTLDQNSFAGLSDGPGGYLQNGILICGINRVYWSPPPNGANQVLVWTGTTYVWENLSQGQSGAAGGIQTTSTPFTETTQTFLVGTFTNATIISAKVVIKSTFNAASTIDIGTSGTPSSILSAANIESSNLGVWSEELYIPYGSATPVYITVGAVNGTSGTGTLILEYINGTV